MFASVKSSTRAQMRNRNQVLANSGNNLDYPNGKDNRPCVT